MDTVTISKETYDSLKEDQAKLGEVLECIRSAFPHKVAFDADAGIYTLALELHPNKAKGSQIEIWLESDSGKPVRILEED